MWLALGTRVANNWCFLGAAAEEALEKISWNDNAKMEVKQAVFTPEMKAIFTPQLMTFLVKTSF